jgi:hypothetical protein
MRPIPSLDALAAPVVGLPIDTATLLAAVVAVLGLSGLTLAAHLHARWPVMRRLPMLGLHVGVSALTVAGGVLLLGHGVLAPVGPVGPLRLVAGLLLGPAVGLLVIHADRVITRWWGSRTGHSLRDNRSMTVRSGRARPAGVAVASTGAEVRATGLMEARNDFAPSAADLRVRLPLLLAVAVAEEVVHRGVLLALALSIGQPVVAWSAAIGAQLVFAVSHVFFGWGQVLSKLPLAGLCTAAVLVGGTVLPAVLAHAIFNAWVWRYHRATPMTTRRTWSAAREAYR